MKSIIRIALLLIVAIIVYNLFFGTEEEKAASKRVIREGKEAVESVIGLLKSEKEKFDQGKYDQALDKLGNMFDNLKEGAKDSKELMDRINDLEQRKEELSQKVEQKSSEQKVSEQDAREVDKELDRLVEDANMVIQQMESQQKKQE